MRRGRRNARLLAILPLLLLGAGNRPLPPAALSEPHFDSPGQTASGLDLSRIGLELEPQLRDASGQGFTALQSVLQPLTLQDGPEGRLGRVVLGLHAHALELPAMAAGLLGEPGTPSSPLEDWRLWLLADVSASSGEIEAARRALEQLLADTPDSPLYLRAMAKAAELAWSQGDGEGAFHLVARARAREARGESGERLERLAWEIASARGDERLRRTTARRLLTEFPFAAADLQVAEVFRAADGKLDWLRILLPSEQLRRAEVLLELGLPPSASITLDAVPTLSRQLPWYLLRARSLTAQHRGSEALELLARAPVTGPEDRAQVEWARAMASLDRSRARRGGEPLSAAERAKARQQGIEHLERTVELTRDHELASSALRRLFEEHAYDERFRLAILSLSRLRAISPQDTTGSRFLWERGWKAYRGHNYSGAVGYWSELADLAPGDSYARGARYWSGRAYEALGDRRRAEDIYREVAAADTTDFYRRHALARLREELRAQSHLPHPIEPWPEDPLLGRARFFTAVGLHHLALSELELLGDRPDRRAAAALEGLTLFRMGRVRQSMGPLRRAFPALATPHQAAVPADALQLYYPLLYDDQVRLWASRRALPVPLVLGVIRQESAFDAGATSHAGARGLMQVMPATARELAGKLGLSYSVERLYEPDYSIQLGTSYLRQVLDMFDDNVELALAGYNAGPYRIRRLWRENPRGELDAFIEGLQMEEPRAYVKRIVLLADSYEQLYPEPVPQVPRRTLQPHG